MLFHDFVPFTDLAHKVHATLSAIIQFFLDSDGLVGDDEFVEDVEGSLDVGLGGLREGRVAFDESVADGFDGFK